MVRGHRGGATGGPSTEGRGRGRGRGLRGQLFHSTRARGSGRARGTDTASSASSTEDDRSVAESTTSEPVNIQNGSQKIASPFAQLHKPKTTTSAGFGGQAAPKALPSQSPLSSSGFGKQPLGSSVASAHRAQGRSTTKVASGASPHVQVDGPSALPDYQKRYDKLKDDRAEERRMAIKNGQMADPNQPTSLKKAITPVGTCVRMCPEFECVERIVQKMVDKSEKSFDPQSDMLQVVDTKMIKRFRRSAAGYDEQLPSDIRTPGTLLHTTNYLIRHVLGGEPLALIHKFVWDRTRSIRNDFSVQQVTHETDVKLAVTCLERIARFHIVSLHLLSDPENKEQFDPHQEREQLNNTMLSLMYYYDDNRERISFPNEIEFRAYYIIFSIQDQRPDLESRVQKWPASLLTSPQVQVALDLYAASTNTWSYQRTIDTHRPNAIAQGFYARFFNIIDSPSVSYLMGCVAEIYFNYVRQTAIRAIWKAYCRVPVSQQHKNDEWTMQELGRELHFDDEEQTIQFCQEQGLELAKNENGQRYINWGNRPVDSIDWSPSSQHSFSYNHVESKRAGRSLVAIVLGMTVREAARMGMVDKSALSEHLETNADADIDTADDDALFVSDKDNKIPEPVTGKISHSLPDDSASATPNDCDFFGNPEPPVGFHVSNKNKEGLSPLSDDFTPTASKDRGVFGNTEQPPPGLQFGMAQQIERAPHAPTPSAFGQPSQDLGQPSSAFGQPSQPNNALSVFGGATPSPMFPSPAPTQTKAAEVSAPEPSSSSPFERITAPPPSSPPFTFSSIKQDQPPLAPAKHTTTDGPKNLSSPSNPFSLFPPSVPTSQKNDANVQKTLFQQSQSSVFTPSVPTWANDSTKSQNTLFQQSQPSPFAPAALTPTNDTIEGQKTLSQQSQSSLFPPSVPTSSKMGAENQKTLFQQPQPSVFPPSATTSANESTEGQKPLFPQAQSSSLFAPAVPTWNKKAEDQKALFQQSQSSLFSTSAPISTTNDVEGKKTLFQPTNAPPSFTPSAPKNPSATSSTEKLIEGQKTLFQPSTSFSPPVPLAPTATEQNVEGQNTLFQPSTSSASFNPFAPMKARESAPAKSPNEGQKTLFQSPSSLFPPAASPPTLNKQNLEGSKALFPPSVSSSSSSSLQTKSQESAPSERHAEDQTKSLQQSQSSLFASSDLTKQHKDAPTKNANEGQLSLSQLGTSVLNTGKLDRPRSATVSSVASAKSFYNRPDQESEEEKQAAWLRLLSNASQKRDREINRKRNREEATQAGSTREPDSKVPKVSEPDEPSSPGRRSARAFYDSLPLPPILERIKAGLGPKPPTTAELDEIEAANEAERLKRKSVIDRDQLLLNEARIVASELDSGPSLVESLLQSDLWKQAQEPRRSSYGPSSFSRSTSYGRRSVSNAQSASPPQWPRHGYDVAHGPDLPPGMPLSRSEMRIRTTGAHGLANVPLRFSPEQKAKMRRQGFIFPEDGEQATPETQSPTPSQTQEQTREKRKSKGKRKSTGQEMNPKSKLSRGE